MERTAAVEVTLARAERRRLPFWLDVVRRLIREKPLGLIGGLLVLILVILAVGAPVIAPYDPLEIRGADRLSPPSLRHPFGTDNLGRDLFSRIVYGARISMYVGLMAVLLSTVISLLIGVVSGYFGGKVDMLWQRLVDAVIAFPGLIFVLMVIAVLGTGINNVILALGVLGGVSGSRVIRGSTLAVKEQAFIEAARALGCGHTRTILVHILPNVMAPAITLATLGLGTAILVEASLSFLGLGVPPPDPTWGSMLSREARRWMLEGPWLAVFPGLFLSLAVFGFNMLGDALRDLLDPRLRGR
ncbi:MAG TPA: ABC transporter permease [Dehalococcoidia bacterium]